MNLDQLYHAIRAACEVAEDTELWSSVLRQY